MSKYTELITNYHATKPKFLAHVDLMTRPLIDVAAATRGLITAFDIDSAVGVQLDILGLWIGRSRVVSQPISGVYFSWDTDGLGYDQGVWQGPYDPDSGYTSLSDDTYRIILKAKIAINNWDGRNDSLPPILDAATAGSGLKMQIVDNQDMTISVWVFPLSLTPFIRIWLHGISWENWYLRSLLWAQVLKVGKSHRSFILGPHWVTRWLQCCIYRSVFWPGLALWPSLPELRIPLWLQH